ncbi:hypothetical protein LJK88_11405 [Paenibacillus sp. P26]|nr:hypothetical protein LJK88_11405 [Paenibacillus sp. P26]
MLHLITGWLTIVTIGLLAVMSPGPNLAVTIRNSLLHSRKAGVYTATGLATGESCSCHLLPCGDWRYHHAVNFAVQYDQMARRRVPDFYGV